MKTQLTAPHLVALRAHGQRRVSRFVDPFVIAQCTAILDRRGEEWAASVLGRDISRRSPAVPGRPYLKEGEEYTLVAADGAEDDMVLKGLEETLA